MTMKITAQHYHRLIELESTVQYQSPSDGGEPFVVKSGEGKVMLSAPHGAMTYRNDEREVWHEEDEYTAGMALLLNEVVKAPVIAMVRKSRAYDPNHSKAGCAYKDEMRRLIQEGRIQYVIDLHGAALCSRTLDSEQTIDLGLRNRDPAKYSMHENHVKFLENLLQATEGNYDPNCFVVKRNKFPAQCEGTITTFASKLTIGGQGNPVQAIQIEMKPQVRVARRFPTATLYQSCGPYEAHPECVMHMLQALADFTDYLNVQ